MNTSAVYEHLQLDLMNIPAKFCPTKSSSMLLNFSDLLLTSRIVRSSAIEHTLNTCVFRFWWLTHDSMFRVSACNSLMEKTFQNSYVSAVNSPPTIYQETWLPIFEALSWVKRHQANQRQDHCQPLRRVNLKCR